MAIIEVRENEDRQLQNVGNALAVARRVVVVTGAGISTNCGIPDYEDFRSEEGLYSLIHAQRNTALTKKAPSTPTKRQPLSPRRHTNPNSSTPIKKSTKQPTHPSNIKGKDLFDAQIWKDPKSTSTFYTFITNLRKTIQEDVKRASPTHRFICTLRDKGKLLRNYTQNIDGLESREGLRTNLELGKGNRARFTKQSLSKPLSLGRSSILGSRQDRGCEVVQLHGDLEVLRCTLCQRTYSWEERDYVAELHAGKAPTCHSCMITSEDRQIRGQRATKIGTLRPNVVLYGEEHPAAEAVGAITAYDLASAPDLLLVLGTSLHVHGLKILVREFAKSVHARKGKVVFVNLSRPSESVWKDVFDYWVAMDCNQWVAAMRRHRPEIFQVQDGLRLPVSKKRKTIETTTKPTKMTFSLSCSSENKENIEIRVPSTPRRPMKQITYLPKMINKKKKDQNLTPHHPPNEIINELPKPNDQSLLDSQLQSESQLPTPPSTGHRSPQLQNTSGKRSLTANYEDFFNTPSKRRKQSYITVWEDE